MVYYLEEFTNLKGEQKVQSANIARSYTDASILTSGRQSAAITRGASQNTSHDCVETTKKLT